VLLSTSSHVVKVLANITNTAAARTVQFSVQRGSDGMFIDSQLNQPVSPTSGSSTTSFSTVSTGVINIQSASAGVSVSTDPSSPNQNVAAGASNVKWASFDMLASGENVKVSDLYVYAVTTGTTTVAANGLNNGKIMVNGVQVGSTHDIAEGASAPTDFSLGSSLILPAGQTTVVDVYADAQTQAGVNFSNGEIITVSIAAGSSNGQGVSSYTTTNVPASLISGNAITISTSSLSAAKSTSYGDQTVVAGSNNAKLGSFALSTGSTGSVSVNTINITFAHAVSSTITNLTIKDSATGAILGSVITTPSTDNSFSVSLTIPASSSKTIDIYGNILSGASNGTIQASVGTGTTGTDSSGQSASVTGSAVPLQSIGLGAGTLSVTNGAGDPVSNNILAGASSVNVGEFSFSAQNSSYTVQNLAILVPTAQANDVTNVTLSYKDVNGATQTATQALVNGTVNATATFQGLTMYVPANDSANVDVSIGTPTIAANATSGAGVKVSLDTTSSTFRAVNSAGTATTTINGGTSVAAGGTFYVRKSIPTFAMIPTGSSIPSTGQPLYKFSITADPAGAIEWTHLTFNIATSGTSNPTITNLYLTDDSSGTSLINGYATTTTTTATIDLGGNTDLAKYQQVAAGATKTYDLYGTVTGFSSPATVTVSLASDGSALGGTNNEVAAPWAAGNVVWSDRSASPHSTGSSDWTNGYLLKNFTSNAISYTI
ncbi:MAG: beta strand repeat-containing protein, partial [Minisyncoccota bacterium]